MTTFFIDPSAGVNGSGTLQNPPAAILAAAQSVMQDMGVSTGNPQVGQTLTATNGTWTNSPTSFTRQWKRSGTAISGATAATYVPIAADVGSTLTVSVTAINGSGASVPATSAATSTVTVAGSVPVNTVLPAISGTPQVGQTLTASNGSWTNSPASSSVATPVDGTYSLIFDEEFNGTSLDGTKWHPNWFGSTATQITVPVNSSEHAAYDPAQISVSGGFLNLTTVNNPITINSNSYTYRTGHINSSLTQGTGGFETNPTAGNAVYIEARVFMPFSGGQVLNWPAWWTVGHNWPAGGEIDIAEALYKGNGQLGVTANYHSTGNDLGSGLFANHYGGWHVFACLWTTTTVTYYYDGIQVKQYTTGIASAPNYIILQNAMGQGIDTAPTTMIVDYVHVYLKNGTPITPQTGYGGPGTPGIVDYTYQWNRAGMPIVGALASTYTPVVADVGSTLTVSVTATNASGASAPATSAATSTVP